MLQSFADQLIAADHYAKGVIANRRNEVLDRSVLPWEEEMTANPLQGCSAAVEGDASCGSSVLFIVCVKLLQVASSESSND